MKILLTACLFIAVFVATVFAQGTGNDNKVFTAPNKMRKSDWFDEKEIQRTWDAALVTIPQAEGKYLSSVMSEVDNKQHVRKAYPTIIYLHGCSGVWKGTYTHLDYFAQSGFAVIAPVSFARNKYPQSCDAHTGKGGLYRGALIMRQQDALHAIKKAKKLPWVDANNVFLVGFSEGAITAATVYAKEPEVAVNARVVEGWTCHAGWHEYQGIKAPKSEPVLALVGKLDPWFQSMELRGDCGSYLSSANGSRSIVFSKAPLASQHHLFGYAQVRTLVIDFLHNHLRK